MPLSIKSSAWRQVPQGHVWLQGDNVHNSTDSRHYGPVPLALQRGRVVCKVRQRGAITMY